ncbi:DNA transposase [Frankliniella fusca]|uniref:DNA transposase n=1 Tax=Frankliniella fusca TaxID=407009 RepID=A0AAE1LHS9_9NEOP|nr:DNA transposase [Frankliniella fusca]
MSPSGPAFNSTSHSNQSKICLAGFKLNNEDYDQSASDSSIFMLHSSPGPSFAPFTPFRKDKPNSITKVVIHNVALTVKLPGLLWGVNTDKERKTAFTLVDDHLRNQKAVVFTHSLKPLVLINKTVIDMPEVQKLHQKVDKIMTQMSKVKEEKINESILSVPEEQQGLVRACFEAAKHNNKKGRRYATDWVYESPTLYEKLRTENKLPLPSKRTLNRYMDNLRPSYGFQENVFSLLKNKATFMQESERHVTITRCIAIDEMAVESRTGFDKNTCQVHGLVTLGETEKDEEKRGNHALVILFQPFKGRWVQAVGAFLSAGAVNGKTLKKL